MKYPYFTTQKNRHITIEIIVKHETGYRGCYSIYDISSAPVYSSTGSMTIGFCMQVCLGSDPKFTNTTFMAIQVI